MYYTIVAPSGSGKSTFLNSSKPHRMLLYDADQIDCVAETYEALQRLKRAWWLDDQLCQMKNALMRANRRELANRFWGRSDAVIFTAEPLLGADPDTTVYVIPPTQVLCRNHNRRRELGVHPVVLSPGQLRTLALEYLTNASQYTSFPCMNTIQSAVQHLENEWIRKSPRTSVRIAVNS